MSKCNLKENHENSNIVFVLERSEFCQHDDDEEETKVTKLNPFGQPASCSYFFCVVSYPPLNFIFTTKQPSPPNRAMPCLGRISSTRGGFKNRGWWDQNGSVSVRKLTIGCRHSGEGAMAAWFLDQVFLRSYWSGGGEISSSLDSFP